MILLIVLFLYFSKRKTAGPESFSIHKMMQWTNLKAVLADAGTGGSYYPNFKPFKTKQRNPATSWIIYSSRIESKPTNRTEV
jgi:hypothetical protein